jgi:alkylated DNA nucleotide flippase Atl1
MIPFGVRIEPNRTSDDHNWSVAAKRKSWTQKWAEAKSKPDLPKVFDCDKSGKRFVVPGPAEIEEIVKGVPEGQVISMYQIADTLARRHSAETCCPMTTGIFAWLMAYASCEAAGMAVDCTVNGRMDAEAAHRGVPWWRVVKTGGELNPKYPGAPELQRALLESEGVKVEPKGKKLVVAA